MKKSKYTYFFTVNSEYIGYSYLTGKYFSVPYSKKESVEKILANPGDIVTNADRVIYSELCDKKFLVNDDYDEYNLLLQMHRIAVNQSNQLYFAILPTLSCNCRCSYCYELHPPLKNSRMGKEIIVPVKTLN